MRELVSIWQNLLLSVNWSRSKSSWNNKAMKENKLLELTFNQQGKKRIKFLKVIKLLVSNT